MLQKKPPLASLCNALAFACIMAGLLPACNRNEQTPVRLLGEAQGSYYSVIYYDTDKRDFQPKIDSLLADFDLTASLWVDSSEICRFNRCEHSLVVSPRFADLFQKSLQIGRETDGAFDCRIGLLVSAYGFVRDSGQNLEQHQIDSLLAVCRGRVWLDTLANGTIRAHKEMAGTRLDFNAIAQGYSVDMLCDFLSSKGLEAFIVDVGGEVRCVGEKPNGQPWVVGIERPAADKEDGRSVEVALQLTDCSIVTSGSYRKYYEKDGIRYSHTIDPMTGRPVAHSTLSVSVIDSMAWRADALATAFMVMGCEKARQWLDNHAEVSEVYIIYDRQGTMCHYATEAFQHRLDATE